MATGTKPKIIYFPIQGRAEPIRLALAAAGVEFDFEAVDKAELKSDLDHYHFAQVPRYMDDEVDLCQSHAIVRHIARKHNLYGKDRTEQARVDEVIEGSGDLALRLFMKYVRKKDDPDAKEILWKEHWDPASATAPGTMGAHAAFLSRLLSKSTSGYFVESGLTVADTNVTVILDLYLLAFGRERLEKQWPDLMALHDRVLAVPSVAAYMSSPQCLPVMSPGLP